MRVWVATQHWRQCDSEVLGVYESLEAALLGTHGEFMRDENGLWSADGRDREIREWELGR